VPVLAVDLHEGVGGKSQSAGPGRTFALLQVNETLSRLLLEAELLHVRVHDLRHTTASTLLEAGVHPKLVQDLLGHSTIAVTLDTYSHVTPALHDQAVHELQQLLVRASGNAPIRDYRGPSRS
jgi:integrase